MLLEYLGEIRLLMIIYAFMTTISWIAPSPPPPGDLHPGGGCDPELPDAGAQPHGHDQLQDRQAAADHLQLLPLLARHGGHHHRVGGTSTEMWDVWPMMQRFEHIGKNTSFLTLTLIS